MTASAAAVRIERLKMLKVEFVVRSRLADRYAKALCDLVKPAPVLEVSVNVRAQDTIELYCREELAPHPSDQGILRGCPLAKYDPQTESLLTIFGRWRKAPKYAEEFARS